MKKQIKTVYCRAEHREEFDKDVNALLKDGWELERIDTLTARVESKYTMLFALLFRQEN